MTGGVLRPIPCPPELDDAMRACLVEEALSGVRHDLRNRIATMSNSVYYLKRKLEAEQQLLASDPRIGQFLALLNEQFETMGASVSPARRDPAALGAHVSAERVAGELAEWLGKHGARLQVRGEPTPVAAPCADLGVALWCLLENALEAAGTAQPISVEITNANDTLRVAVIDAGPGFTPEARTGALKRGFSTKARRLGAGLKIVQRIANRYSGKVEVADASPRGARVSFTLSTKPGTPR